jgi:uncharacterized protein
MKLEEHYKKKIIDLISVLLPHVKIYLFGSRAREKHHETSDIDIALDGNQKLSIVDVGEVREVLNAINIPYKIDVVDFYRVYPAMQEMILKEGILWKS